MRLPKFLITETPSFSLKVRKLFYLGIDPMKDKRCALKKVGLLTEEI
jgi:hypothetical protein